jgi:hypothetical protein
MSPSFYHFFFQPTAGSWYTGNVWGNMVAWVICGVVAILWGRRKFIRWDDKRKKLDSERHAEHIALLNKHHKELKAHITKLGGK